MTCRIIVRDGAAMWACTIDPEATWRARSEREAAELLEDQRARDAGYDDVEEEHEEGEDGCDWRGDGDDEEAVGDRLSVIGIGWFAANLDEELAP